MSSHVDVVGSAAIVLVLVIVAAWLVSLVARDAGVVAFGCAFGVMAMTWTAWAIGDGNADRAKLLVAMVTIWGGWAAFHAARRTRDHTERRVFATRRAARPNFAISSFFTVFFARGLFAFVVALPAMIAMTPTSPAVGVFGVVGSLVWGIGLFFEVVGDTQLMRFAADTANDRTVLDDGLWQYSRHPNHFGTTLVWWGVWIVAAESVDALPTIVGPLLLTGLLLHHAARTDAALATPDGHSGGPADYASYAERTARFVPRAPKVTVEP